MTEYLNIISSKVVSSEFDQFWLQGVVTDELQRGTLILSTPYQPGSAEETQLQKILQACTLTADNYHIIQLEPEQQLAWHQLRDKIHPQQVILFGIMPQQLGISSLFKLNEPNKFNDCIWIPSFSIPELEKQPEAKKALWVNALKPVFVDKAFEPNR